MSLPCESIDPLELARRRPDMSAERPLTWPQRVTVLALAAAVCVLSWRAPGATGRGFIVLATAFYLVFTLYKFLLLRASVTAAAGLTVTEEALQALDPASLPVYSILVPMYREPESVAAIVKALDALDYPAEKKDVQLLLEADDEATLAAAAAVRLPPGFRVTRIPPSFPRTKPKACNIGLGLARGTFLVIYDAEDRPESDQLLKAVAGFAVAEPEVVCLQSSLSFYNPRQNLLTRWFTAEYAAWFDLSLPGLCSLGAVIPLGGTSNHFRTEHLRRMMGWDAYNVTEDCDLGVRIYRMGFRSCMLNTTTWEEACGSLPYWIRQRTRWLKGYIQTYVVHMRRPWRLLRELGPANMLHFQLLIGGIVLSFLMNPLFWSLAALWFLVRLELLSALFSGLVFAMGTFCLFIGNFALAYAAAVGAYRRRYFDLVKYAWLSPLYWILMSYSGWRAFFQFFSDPFHWEKTRHGLSGAAAAAAADAGGGGGGGARGGRVSA